MPASKQGSSVASAGSRNILVVPATKSGATGPLSKLNPTSQLAPTAQSTEVSNTGPAPNAWSNGGGRALAKSTASTAAPTLLKSVVTHNMRAAGAQRPSESELTSRMGEMNLRNPFNSNAPAFNPSEGPTQSQVSANWRWHRRSPSQASNGSLRQAIHTMVCKLSGFTKRDFRQGEVIALPFHTANTNPSVNPNDPRLALTCEGPAYSKRRMMVILWMYQYDMFCVPLYSFEGKGIAKKPDFQKREYVTMKNVGDKDFVNDGLYPPVEVRNRTKPMDPKTVVHITGGMKVNCSEDITMVGRLEVASYRHLVRLWTQLSQEAQSEGYRT